MPAGISVHTHLEHADSFTHGLLAAAARLQANLIVIGAATHGLLGRFAIGSVAGGLLHSSPVTLFVTSDGVSI
ncbi:universal stress protein [Cryobacterium ruanii]|uniref:universal stress protein n=1 Tax=Cryobacterium ruanii TaxID=1259197 RepID=UPI00141BE03F|nr:universal stress protein [Cryobacterium ruanii]